MQLNFFLKNNYQFKEDCDKKKKKKGEELSKASDEKDSDYLRVQ